MAAVTAEDLAGSPDDLDDGGGVSAVSVAQAAEALAKVAPPAPPAPEPAAPAAAPGELSPQLRDLRRDVADAHAVAVRTSNAVTTLAASLKEVIQRQNRYDRGLNLNSFIAYVIFTTLLGGGFFMLYRSRAERLVSERDQALRARQTAVDEAGTAKKELDEREAAQRKALDYWQLLSTGKREEAIAKYGEITHERLTPVETQVFQQGVQKARAEIVDGGYAEGLEAFNGQQWKRATQAFQRALKYEDEGPRAAQMRYYQGVAMAKLGDYAGAQHELELAIAGGVERTVGPDARYVEATALEALRQWDRARTEYDKFAAGHPQHPLAGLARMKVAKLAALKAPAGQGAPAAPAPAAVAPQ
jgi:TolA-binding protein